MKHYVGESLDDYLSKIEKDEIVMTTDDASKLTFNLLSAVAAVHSANVIHRDIKPENIIINDQLEVRLCDFSAARVISEDYSSFEPPYCEEKRKETAKDLTANRPQRKKR